MGKYLNRFLALRCAPDILATVGHLGNKPEKEISEAFAVVREIRKITLKTQDHFQVVDLCSGNALVPVTAIHLLPITYAYAVDKLPRERRWDLANNFKYIQKDIYEVDHTMFTKPTILTAVHSCRDLAEQTIQIYKKYHQIKHLILMPCCHGKLDNSILNFIKKEATGDLAWVVKLALQCGENVRVTKDNHILSPKNYIIIVGKNND